MTDAVKGDILRLLFVIIRLQIKNGEKICKQL